MTFFVCKMYDVIPAGINKKWTSSHGPFNLLDDRFNSTNEIRNEECQ